MATAQVLLDTTQYVRVTDRFDVIWLQCLRDTVRIVFSDAKPSRSNTTFHLLSGDDPMMEFDTVDTSIWALATTKESTLVITNVSNIPKIFSGCVNITIPPQRKYSLRLQKNSNVSVEKVQAKGATIRVVKGEESGTVVALNSLIPNDGLITPDFVGLIEVYDGPAIGDTLFTNDDVIDDEFYPDGNYVIELFNDSDVAVNTNVCISVRQVSITGIYTILEPDTQLEPDTEMSIYNGTN